MSGYQTLTSAVNAMGALLLRTVTNGGGETNQGRLVLLAPCLADRVVDTLQVTASKLDRDHRVRAA